VTGKSDSEPFPAHPVWPYSSCQNIDVAGFLLCRKQLLSHRQVNELAKQKRSVEDAGRGPILFRGIQATVRWKMPVSETALE
jgi:hypothetical protein